MKLIYGNDAPEMLEEELFGDLASWDVLEEYINFADSHYCSKEVVPLWLVAFVEP